jgi:tetratricopeptide (TPR) repeat protein
LVIGTTQGVEAKIPLVRNLAEQGGDVRERQWGYVGWSATLGGQGRYDEAALRARQGIALDPTFGKIYGNLGDALLLAGRSEQGIEAFRQGFKLIHSPEQSQLSAVGFAHAQDYPRAAIHNLLRDDRGWFTVLQHEGALTEYNGNSRSARMNTLVALARLGELRRAAASIPLLPFTDPAFSDQAKGVAAGVAMEAGRTEKAVALVEQVIAAAKLPKGKTLADVFPTGVARYAEMLVAAGRAADAAKTIAPTRGDCYPCLVARGEVAAAQRDTAGATRWFAEAARQGPSLPQADYRWGRMLAANHDRAGALAHFAVAAKRAPGWYEPPYASGRLLMAQNRFPEAQAALEKAHAAAPKRADVMLALGRSQWLGGDRVKAKATWADARKLDLLEPDLAWLKVIDAAVKRAGKTY